MMLTMEEQLPGDTQLLEKSLQGNQAALGELFERYFDPCFAIALAVLGSHADAEEAVQNSFLALVKDLQKFSQAGNFESFFLQTTRNQALKILRDRKNKREVAMPVVELLFMAKNASFSADEIAGVDRFLRDLPPEQREVIILHIVQDMPFTDITELTGEKYKTITSRYQYAMEKLRRKYNHGTF